ncbi:hypothetical protein TNCV_2290162 [Trichonephila clavipes]|uniref:Uncharacterized protein n=1 Tax=Trichonephila clavipes TaxID=2585209 RepID=A0A8X6RNN7_TRICX|nr:hypothetical protein TNCV_2290162 [Trichonephila clavipes]
MALGGSLPQINLGVQDFAALQRKLVICEQDITCMTSTTQGLLVTDFVILNHGQVTRTTSELAPPSPNFHPTPMGGCLGF